MSKVKLCSTDDCIKKKRRRMDNEICNAYGKEDTIFNHKVFHGDSEEKNNVQYLQPQAKLLDDSREYRTIKLNNGLRALLICDKKNEKVTEQNEEVDEKIAYCSLCINVGDFSDPPHIQGLAHLLEHVIMMGSKKYPQENEFNAFITNRWGTNNAFTEHERTTYAFEVPDKYLAAAMDHFAQVFIDPLMSKDTISRERQAVESEFKLNQQLDACRREQLKHSLARHSHPASKFSWGNLITLDKNIDLDDLCVELHKFHKRHYSAHRMTLAVKSSQSLDILEQYIKILFSDVPVNYLPADDFSMYKGIESFDRVKFRKLYYVKTITDIPQIELNWVMPPMQHLYKSKPWEYVIWLFTREEKGSLLNYLCKKMWCVDVRVQRDDDESFCDTSMYYLMSLSFSLSDEGYANYEEVLNSIFSYINLLKREGVQKEIFDHIRQTSENNYKSNFNNENEHYVEYLSQNMQYYEPSDYIHGYDLIFEYDPKAIQSCLNYLSAENVNIIISSKTLKESEMDKIEPWFQTKYTNKEIPKKWIERWCSIDPLLEFNLSLKKSSPNQASKKVKNLKTAGTIPVKLNHKDIEVWYKKISDSKSSEFTIYLHLINPLCYKSIFHSAMMLMMIIVAETRASHDISDLRIFPSVKGIIIEYDSCKTASLPEISKLLEMLMKCQIELKEKIFNSIKQEVLRMLHNCFIDPDDLSVDICQTVITPYFWSTVEKYNAVLKINFSQFIEHAKNFQKEFYLQCFIKGSLTDEEVLNYVDEAIKPLRTSSSLLSVYTDKIAHQFERGERFCQVQNLNSFDFNTVVMNYYQAGTASAKSIILSDLLLNIMDVPLFDVLRTKEQLGYKLSCRRYFYEGVMCILICITTQADKFTACYIDERIENFMKHFQGILMAITADELKLIKENYYVHSKRQGLEGNEGEGDYDWMQITSGEYLFRQRDEEMEIAQNINLEDLIQYFNSYMIPGSNYRKLSVQVVGASDLSSTGEEHEEKYTLKFSTEVTEEKKQEKAGCFIEDIDTFRKKFFNKI